MNRHQVLLAATLSSVFTLLIVVGSLLIFSRAAAAPSTQPVDTAAQQGSGHKNYVSVSALSFIPTQQTVARVGRDFSTQLLVLTTNTRDFNANNSFFWAPLNLPDHSRLIGMTVFGVDSDSQGNITMAFRRCDHSGNDGCKSLYETDTGTWSGGKFETPVVPMDTEVDNSRYTYHLALSITTLSSNNKLSGLRSVILEMELPIVQSSPTSVGGSGEWKASPNERHKIIQRLAPVVVEFCTKDQAKTRVWVDGQIRSVFSVYSGCVQEAGTVFEVEAEIHSITDGTYKIIQ